MNNNYPVIHGRITQQKVKGRLTFHVVTVLPEIYDGDYEVTPTQETQILLTKNKAMAEDVVINPIPSNYGLITYNGFGLTVS